MTGSVTVSVYPTHLDVSWNLSGADTGCTDGCGLHIHTGYSCSDHTLVGGHYYLSDVDEWNDLKYYVDAEGNSIGSGSVDVGIYSWDMLSNRAFVIHDSNSATRASCSLMD